MLSMVFRYQAINWSGSERRSIAPSKHRKGIDAQILHLHIHKRSVADEYAGRDDEIVKNNWNEYRRYFGGHGTRIRVFIFSASLSEIVRDKCDRFVSARD